ncbi:osteocalcin [Protobothrops mucrosquamatus]|uniref:osteocalcin n=1 Tax=Protobothrops mucrosquamatus TaxID=103944 RepID=UPI000775BC1C|nr:osteocalcin [Protobothrops mucrosquamatus]
MNALLLAALCALAGLCLARPGDAAHARSADGSPSGYDAAGAAPQVAVNPFEAQREVCELSPGCDELADQIGFQEAYRQFYGPI